ncbi:MAG: carboxypeptidase regulatory-like domain-containing protein [Acidobacteriota bacterium]
MRLVLLFAALACVLRGQTSASSLLGRVVDESGGAVRDVRVTAQRDSTGFLRTARTGDDGAWRIEHLQPGAYTIRAVHEGFKTAVVPHVALDVGRDVRLDLRLAIGEARESVNVNAAISPLETQDSAIGYRVDSMTAEQLPLDERDVSSLVTLGPGAVPRHLSGLVHDADNDVQQGSRGSVAFNPAINGARPSMNAFSIDGAYDTDRNVFALVINPPLESVQEFRTQSSVAPVAFTQAGGGTVDLVTKSGSRDFHGSAFEYFRNEALDARSYFEDPTLPRVPFRRNQFGGSLGGPLPFHSFFFFAYEGLRGASSTPSLQQVPDARLRSGDFSGLGAIYDPLSAATAGARAPFPGNVIPAGRIDPIAQRYLDQFEPLPNRPGNAFGNYFDSSPSSADHDSASGRVDHQFARAGLLFGRYTINDERGGIGGSFPLRPTTENLRAQQAVVGHTLAGAAWTNELRLSFTRLRLFDVPQSASGQNVAAELGILNPPTDPASFGLPFFFLANFSTVTDDPTLPQIQRDNTWNVSETFSRVSGKRSYKLGFNWIHFQLNYRQSNQIRGRYTYSGAFTGNGADPNSGNALADFLLGFPQSTERSAGDSQAYLRQNTFGGFAQQDWQLSSSLSLSLGLRYEYSSPFTDASNRLLNLDYSTLPAQPKLVPVKSAYNPNRLDFAPRAGLAWRFGNTVFRAGYGIYFNPEIAVESYDLVLNGIRNEINTANAQSRPVLTTRDGFPTTAGSGLPSYFGVDPNLPTPYVQQWNAGFQREMPGGIVAEFSYVGSKGTHLGRFRRFNTALHTETGENLDPRPGDLQSLRTFPDLGTLFQFEHIANSSYNSLQLKAEKRFQRSLSFLASFVWSKSLDDSSTVIPGLFDGGGAQDERNLRLERAPSTFNVGRRLSAGFVYSFPGRGRLLGGWQMSGIVTIQDGTPLDPLFVSTDTANAGTFTRPDIVPGQSISLPASQRTPEHWFNTNAFAAPAPFRFGNAGRNSIPGPGNEVIDLAVHKRFAVTERLNLELRAESFNLLNHPNFGFPDPYPDQGPFFGRILITGQPRRVQFATRFTF